MSTLKDVWGAIQTIATFSKELDRCATDIRDMRQELRTLSEAVVGLKARVDNLEKQTEQRLESFAKDLVHAKEQAASVRENFLKDLENRMLQYERKLQLKGQDEGARSGVTDRLLDE